MTKASGVANPNVIDLVTQKADGTVCLIMIETRAWDGSNERLFEIQQKANAYLAYALDGAMVRDYPNLEDRPIQVQLDSQAGPPDPTTADFLERLREVLAAERIGFVVNVV